MKIVVKNSSLVYQKNILKSLKIGLDTDGIIDYYFLTKDYNETKYSGGLDRHMAISPYINIEGINTDINLTQVRVPKLDNVIGIFYTSDTSTAYIPNSHCIHFSLEGEDLPSFNISNSSIPENAKYFRWNINMFNNPTTSDDDCPTISFGIE